MDQLLAAAGELDLTYVNGFFTSVIGFINGTLVPFIFALAFIFFLWKVYQYFIAGGANEEKRAEGAKFVLTAVVGFAVMLSLWGLVNVLVATFKLGGQRNLPIPTIDTSLKGSATSNTPQSAQTTGSASTSNCSNDADLKCPSGWQCVSESGKFVCKPAASAEAEGYESWRD